MSEPVAVLGAVQAGLQVAQTQVPMAAWAHGLVAAALAGLAAYLARRRVTPVRKGR